MTMSVTGRAEKVTHLNGKKLQLRFLKLIFLIAASECLDAWKEVEHQEKDYTNISGQAF